MARALIVIDIQKDYFPGGVLPLWQAEETEARLVAAIGRARAAGDRVIHIRHISTAPTGLFVRDSVGSEIRPAILAAAPDAPVVIKQMADSFQETTLATHLDGIDDILVCGMMTQNCVAFTALSRLADPWQVTVIPELCTAPIEIVHLIAASALASKVAVADVATLWP